MKTNLSAINHESPNFQVVEMTPEWAGEILKRNIENRPIKKTKLSTYVSALKAGDWLLNGDPIRLYSNGDLCDGQHRLHACLQSGVSFHTVLATGLDKSVHGTIDIGASRTASDHLVFKLGIKPRDASCIAAGCKIIMAHDDGVSKWAQGGGITQKYGTPSMVESWVEANMGVSLQAVDMINRVCKMPALMQRSSVFALYILACRDDEELASEYFSSVFGGVNLVENTNVAFIRAYLLRQLSHSRPAQSFARVYSVAKTWKSTLRGYSFAGPNNVGFKINSDNVPTFPGFGAHDYKSSHEN